MNKLPLNQHTAGLIPAAHANETTQTGDFDPFFAEPVDYWQEARDQAIEVICRLLVWVADGRTLGERGLRTSVALYCIRPDLIESATLEQIGDIAGCSRQAVHKLAASFRETTGLRQ
jgi:hypothetical protein